MERDSGVFYKSFYEAINELPDDERLIAYDAVMGYMIAGIEPDNLTGMVKAIFALIKPQIDANNKKFIDGQKGAKHGKKGGRPKKEKPPKGLQEKTPVGISAETPNVNVNVNANVNANVNDNVVADATKGEKTETETETGGGDLSKICHKLEKNFGRLLNPIEIEKVGGWIDKDNLSPELIFEAIRRAVLGGKMSIRYIDSILLSWTHQNLRTLAEVKARDKPKGKRAKPEIKPKAKSEYDAVYDKLLRPG
ncbi:MAG: DnaD domain protein [Bacillota bacterium]|jgi:DnaD/phage-associated family protein